jgi:hypothetical protein
MMKQNISFFLFPLTVLSLALSVAAPVSAQAQTASTGFCYTFTRNLGEGRPLNTQDAQALTQALINAGVWNVGSSITTYNDAVASAVSGFQEKYASQILTPNGLNYGTGYVGTSTRAELNSLYGCASTNTATQQTFQCPAGWTCTPPSSHSVTYSCPLEWTCAPTASTTAPTVNSPITTTIQTPTSINDYPIEGAGARFSLPATPTIIKQISAADASGNYSATYTATFNVQVAAVTNAILGLQNSSLPAVISDNSFISIFKNSSDINGHYEPLSDYNPIIAYSPPANTTLSNDGAFFTIGANQTVMIPISVSFTVQNPGADAYAVALRGVNWTSSIGGSIQYSALAAPNPANTLMTSSI